MLISGLGIGGPTLAYWLKAAGFEPTLIEHAPSLRTGGYVIDFWGLGYDIAERMGLAGEINRIGYHMREMRIVDGGGRRPANDLVKLHGMEKHVPLTTSPVIGSPEPPPPYRVTARIPTCKMNFPIAVSPPAGQRPCC